MEIVILSYDRYYTHTHMLSRVHRLLLRTIQRHFTLRLSCCSFEVYEIGCASPLTGSAARDDGMNSCTPYLPSFYSLIYVYVRMYVHYLYVHKSFFFNSFVKDSPTIRCTNQYLRREFLILRRSSFDDLSDR